MGNKKKGNQKPASENPTSSQPQAQSQQQSVGARQQPQKKGDPKSQTSAFQLRPVPSVPASVRKTQPDEQEAQSSSQASGQLGMSAWGQQKKTNQPSHGPKQQQPKHVQVASSQSNPQPVDQPVAFAWGQQQQRSEPTHGPKQQPEAQTAFPWAQKELNQPNLVRQQTADKSKNVERQQQGKREQQQQGKRDQQQQGKRDQQQQRKREQQHSRMTADTQALEEDIKNVSIASIASSGSSASSVLSSGQSSVIATSALIPVAPNKGCGTKGRKVHVDVNYLPLLIENLIGTVYQYDVTIEPNLPKRMLPIIFEQYRHNNFSKIFMAFDGQKIAVIPQILPDNPSIQSQTTVIDENGRERVYMVSMKEARDSKIDFNSLKNYTALRQYDAPLRAIQMLEIVLKSAFLNKNGVQVGRSFYMTPSRQIDLGDNYELWTGLYQATVLGSIPYLNVDIAHKAFPSTLQVIDMLSNMRVDLRKRLDPRTERDLLSHLKGLMINYKMPSNEASCRTFKFLSLSADSRTVKFRSDQDNKEYNLVNYFQSRGVTIQYPNLQTLKLGNAIKNITVPMEFCSIAGYQAVNKKCTEMQTRNMIKEAATSTDVRKQKIMDMLQKIAHNNSKTLNQFGIIVGNDFSRVPARVLDAPTLEYRDKKTVLPRQGQWKMDNLQFLRPSQITKYAVLAMDRYVDDRSVRPFCESINKYGRSIGMHIEKEYETIKLDPFSKHFVQDLHVAMSRLIAKKIELLFCIIPDRGDTYSKVKQCAELDCGILTQCIKAITLNRKGTDPSTVTNILLKVNAKLNGTNHKLAPNFLPPLMKQPFMIIGADVTHPSPGQENIPSVVGVVSSHDVHGFQYNKCWRLQNPKEEIISGFAEIIKEHLAFFKQRNNCLPKVILYFRDGVSEGQFQHVLTEELNAMYSGCQQFENGYKPKITFLIVQKRHHTRFFPPPNSGLGRDDRRNNNVPPGTIVDNEITHPNECQFFLVSHQSIQGVARPTKYCLLRDDSNISIDELQALTYNLCHFFARCTRTVSYPAPTYYAHLAAARGRVYIEGCSINMTRLDKEFKDRTIKEEINKKHPMYFI